MRYDEHGRRWRLGEHVKTWYLCYKSTKEENRLFHGNGECFMTLTSSHLWPFTSHLPRVRCSLFLGSRCYLDRCQFSSAVYIYIYRRFGKGHIYIYVHIRLFCRVSKINTRIGSMKNCQETIIYTWYTWWKQWKHMFVVYFTFNECIESTIWLYNDLTTSSLNMWLAVKHPFYQVGELFVIQPDWINHRISAVSSTLIGWWFCLDNTGCRPSTWRWSWIIVHYANPSSFMASFLSTWWSIWK